jgi:acid phosphatase (class A)
MRTRSNLERRLSLPAILLRALLSAALLSSCSSAPTAPSVPAVVDPVHRADLPDWAKPYYLKSTPFRPQEVIPPPPAEGSDADRKDLAIVRERQKSRTKSQCELASTQEIPRFANSFFRRPDAKDLPDFSKLPPETFAKVKALFEHVQRDVGFMSFLSKEIWRRPRPPLRDPSIRPCIRLETSFAYPSGHAAFGDAGWELLSAVWPRYSEAFKKAGKSVGENRIVGGVHHPSDVEAGYELAHRTFMVLMESPEFRADLADVRAALESTAR